jgi:hypothetical protein
MSIEYLFAHKYDDLVVFARYVPSEGTWYVGGDLDEETRVAARDEWKYGWVDDLVLRETHFSPDSWVVLSYREVA